MIEYIVKAILCSSVFILIYKLSLEKEKMYVFNRFYLLASLLLSFLVPLLKFNTASIKMPVSQNDLSTLYALQETQVFHGILQSQHSNYTFKIWILLYAIITTFLFSRFLKNLNYFNRIIKGNQTLPFGESKIVLVNEQVDPHSFLSYIFVNIDEYHNGNVESEILIHENAHVNQIHSFDIILVEILQVFLWFNFVIYFFRKAIQLNHEFLADESVISVCENVQSYKYLLIEKTNKNKTYSLASQFNYFITKKRLIMMSKEKSQWKVLFLQVALIPVFAFSIFTFSSNSFAQEIISSQKNKVDPHLDFILQDGVSEELMNEYGRIVSFVNKNKGKVSDLDKKRLETIFLSMSKEQQDKQTILFRLTPGPLPRVVPTEEELESWKDPKIYGVWINGKRVNNSELNKYKKDDFAQAFSSKLAKNAVNYGKHYFQIDLMTNDEYEVYLTKDLEKSTEKYSMFFRKFK